MLHINDITYRIGDRLLLEGATAGIPAGHKVGLVGKNGTGKTTLLKIILGELGTETGSITTPRNARIGTVAQEAPGTDDTLIETVLAADTERANLLAEAETATDAHRIAEIQTRLADIDAHSAPARAATILAGLGFDHDAQHQPCREFSGGWRMRVALAAILFSKPDILLLDEPTNYLDLEGTIWLENYLKTYPYTVVIVSHDRNLLNKCVTSILHLSERKLTLYAGGYDRFERTRREKQELLLKLREKQQNQRRHMQAFVDRFRYKASKAKQAQSRLKALERLEPIATMVDEHTVPFNIPNPKMMKSPLVRMEKVAVGYEEGKPILKNIDLRLDMDDRIALLGANGNGKSTFAKLLARRLLPMDGKLFASKKIDIAYFAQHQLDELNPEETAFDHFRTLMGEEATQAQIRARLGSYGFGIEKADLKVKKLSGGEKARLLLAIATFKGPHILILDEPTNHLDVDSREALVHALNEFEGAVILISHDRHLIETSADRLWMIADGTLSNFEGDLDDYERILLQRNSGKSKQNAERSSDSKQSQRQSEALNRKALQPLKKAMEDADRRVHKLQDDLAKLDKALAIPGIYQNEPEKATRFAQKRAEVEALIDEAEHDWLEKSEAYEKAKGG